MAEIARTFTKAALSRIAAANQGAKLIGATLTGYTSTHVQGLLEELATTVAAKIGTTDARLTDNRTPLDSSVTTAKLAASVLATDAEALAGSDASKIIAPARYKHLANVGTFKAYKSATTQSVTVATNTKVTFDAEDLDYSNWYDTATSRFTPQRAGWYLIGMGIRYSAGEDTQRYDTWIAKNGTLTTIAATLDNRGASGTGQISQVAWAPVLFNGTTDFIEGAVFVSGGTTRTISTGSTLTWLAGFPIYFK